MKYDGLSPKKKMRRRREGSGPNAIPGLIAVSVVLAGRSPLAASTAAAEGVVASPPWLVADGGNDRSGNNWRRRRLKGSAIPNTCVEGTSLHPGETLSRGEFLCHGSLRFGIDGAFGRFILGFAEPVTQGNSSNVKNNTETVMPMTVAWTAIPTTLFMEKTHPFDSLSLSPDGNLFGYDASGEEVYDSNYDYYSRLHSKADDSILSLSPDCGNVTTMRDGAMCVTLTSPQMPGLPHGEVTWGVEVRTAHLDAAPTPGPGDAFTQLGGPPPTAAPRRTSRPTRNRTRRPTPAPVAVARSTVSPTYRQNLFGQGKQDEPIFNIEPTSIFWGKAWLDANRNGVVDPYEDNLERLEVTLYECSGASVDRAVQSMATDGQGMYVFKVRTGRPFRIHFAVPDPDFGFSSGGDTDVDVEGWTSCVDSRSDQPIRWNAGMYNGTAAREYQGMPDIGMLPSIAFPPGGLPAYDADPISEEYAFTTGPTSAPVAKPIMSSIGGFIYLDVDESGTMEAKEHAAAVGGYTVSDAVIVVSLEDCESNAVLDSIDVQFPGTYTFDNLTEGFYKLGYEMVVLARSEADPLYSFVDKVSVGRSPSTLYETQCGKVGKGEVIEDGNVGLRMAPLNIMSKGPVGGPVGPDQLNLDEMEAMSAPVGGDDKEMRTAAAEGEEARPEEGGDASSFLPALVGVIVALSVLVVLSAMFVKHRGVDLNDAFPFFGGAKRVEDRVDARSVGSSIGGDAAPRADRTAIGSLVVEASKSVAALTVMGAEYGSDDNDDCSDSDQESFTGMEFALKGPAASGEDGAGGASSTTSDSHSHIEEVREEGSEGYEGYEVYDDEDDEDDEEKNGHGEYGPVISDMIAKYSQKAQAGSDEERLPTAETAERIDAQEGGDRSPVRYHEGDRSPVRYHQGDRSPARYHNQGAQGDEEPHTYCQDNVPSQDYSPQQYAQDQGQSHGRDNYHAPSEHHQDPELQENNQDHYHPSALMNQDQSQNYPHQQFHQQGDEQERDPDYYQYLQNQPHYQEDMEIVQSGAGHQDSGAEQQHYQQYDPDYQNHQGYYSNGAAYEQQHQYQYGGVQPQPQYDEQTSTSGSSRSSSDPPAASYRDIQHPPSKSGAMVGWGDRGVPQTMVDHHQYLVSDHQHASDDGYAGADAAYNEDVYAADNYKSSNQYVANSDQYMDGDNDVYPNHYTMNNNTNEVAYTTTEYDNDHPHNYGENTQNDYHEQIDSDTSDSDSDSSSSSSSDSEQVSSSGWSSSSSTANSSVVSGSSKWSSYSSSSNAKKMKARRAQSNPRDNRRGWSHHQAAIPENSTVEYNAYTMTSDGIEAAALEDSGGGVGRSVTPPLTGVADDSKSVLSSGSDQSSDPPGASYKNIGAFPPPPLRSTTPSRRDVSSNPNAVAQRARSVPPRRAYPSPPLR